MVDVHIVVSSLPLFYKELTYSPPRSCLTTTFLAKIVVHLVSSETFGVGCVGAHSQAVLPRSKLERYHNDNQRQQRNTCMLLVAHIVLYLPATSAADKFHLMALHLHQRASSV